MHCLYFLCTVLSLLVLYAHISHHWFAIKRLWYRCRVEQSTIFTLLRESDHLANEHAQCERKVSEIGGDSKQPDAAYILENTNIVSVHKGE